MVHAFEAYELDEPRCELRRRGQIVPLQPKVYELLVLLVQHRDRVLDKSELIDRLWPDAVVGESSLTRLVSLARAALADPPKAGRVIQTVPKRGYRFVAEVTTLAEDEAAPQEIPPVEAVAPPVEAPPVAPVEPATELAVPRATEGERRQLTVLSCDLADSAALAGELDPEDWHDLLRDVQSRAAEIVVRFGGAVAQVQGDGLLVYFGHPVGQEDDAERAVRAGLEIAAALDEPGAAIGRRAGRSLRARVGIHSGPIVVSDIRGDARRDTLASGPATRIAAAIQASGAPGSVRISADALRLVRGALDTESLGRVQLEGLPDGLDLHRVVRLRPDREGLDRAEAVLTPYVGREQERGLLRDRFEHAREGEGQSVLVLGEPGVGKTRLLRAFREQSASAVWLECRCSPYAKNRPLHAVVEGVERLLDFRPEEPAELSVKKLESALASAGVAEPEALPLLSVLLSLPPPESRAPLAPEAARRRTLETLVAWFRAMGERHPFVLVVEDLHWSDPSTLELLGMVIEESPSGRVLTVLTARPEFEAPWPLGTHWAPLVLGRLPQRHARELVAALCDPADLGANAVEQILERSDGIPLYLEELTRAAMDAAERDAAGDIPMTLRDSLESRLDRAGAAKEVAQVGSVLGREFPYPLLAVVTEREEPELLEQLGRLTAAGLVFRRGSPPNALYTFKHSLVQDTAYDSLLRRQRRVLHERAALALEEHFPERCESEPEELARHWEAAGADARAILYYQRAGNRAAQRSATAEAVSHLERALELVRGLEGSEVSERFELPLQVSLGTALLPARGYASPEVVEAFDRARQLCHPTRQSGELAYSIGGLCAYYLVKGELATARELATQLLEETDRSGNEAYRPWGLLVYGLALHWGGRPAEALEVLEKAMRLYDPEATVSLAEAFGHDHGVVSRSIGAHSLWTLGYPERARAMAAEAVEIARDLSHPYSLAFACNFAAGLEQMIRDTGAAVRWADETIALSTEQGFPLWLGSGMVIRGWARVQSGAGPAALADLTQGAGHAAGTGAGIGVPLFLGLLAESQQTVGNTDDAAGAVEAALGSAGSQGIPFWNAELYRIKGELAAARGADDAEECLRFALGWAREQGARSFELRACLSLGRLLQQQSRAEEARRLVSGALEGFSEGFDMPDLVDARAFIDGLP